MKTKIELINGKYYDVTYDENDVAILMVLIGNHDDMLSQINFMLKEKSDEIISLKEELQSKEFGEKVDKFFNTKNDERILKVKCLLNNLGDGYIHEHNVYRLLQNALQDKYSLEEFECEIKSKNLAHDQSTNNDDIIAQLKMILQSQNNTQQLDNPPLPKKCSFEDALNNMQPSSHGTKLADSLAHDQSTNNEDIHDLKNWKKLEVEQFNVLMDIFHTPCLMFKLKK